MIDDTKKLWATVRDNGISPIVLEGMRKELRIVFAEHGFDVAYIPSMDDDNGNTLAARIVADHNACLGIVDPATTVPELVAALAKCLKTIAHLASKPIESQCLLDWGNLEDAGYEARDVLAKTGQTTPPPSAD